MRAVVFDPGAPGGWRLADLPDPGRPARGELRVRMLMAPVNPADRLLLDGLYTAAAKPGEVVGAEGAGIVEEGDPALVGKRVMLLTRGNWAEVRVVPRTAAIVMPDALPVAQAAILRINPATAYRLLDRLGLVPGERLIQNAAGSSVAGWVRRLARVRRIEVIDVVRRPCGLAGALIDEDGLDQRIGGPAQGALDAVAGPSTGRLAACLSEGHIIVYGHLSGAPAQVPSMLLTQRPICIEGFSLRLDEAADQNRGALYDLLAQQMIETPEPIRIVHPLSAFADAIADRASGRMLIDLQS